MTAVVVASAALLMSLLVQGASRISIELLIEEQRHSHGRYTGEPGAVRKSSGIDLG